MIYMYPLDIYVSTVSGVGSDTGCICCIWSQLAQRQSILYLLYLEQSWIQGRYNVYLPFYPHGLHLSSRVQVCVRLSAPPPYAPLFGPRVSVSRPSALSPLFYLFLRGAMLYVRSSIMVLTPPRGSCRHTHTQL